MDDNLRERLAAAFRSSTRSPHHMALLALPVVEDLIREAKAEAWDEGNRAMYPPLGANPYRD